MVLHSFCSESTQLLYKTAHTVGHKLGLAIGTYDPQCSIQNVLTKNDVPRDMTHSNGLCSKKNEARQTFACQYLSRPVAFNLSCSCTPKVVGV